VDASSVSIDHDNLTNVTTSQHHVKTVASELNLADLAEKNHASLTNVTASQHHVKTVASELNLADLAEKNHASLDNVTTSQHHTKYTDAEAILAVEGEATLDLTGKMTISGVVYPHITLIADDYTTDNAGIAYKNKSGSILPLMYYHASQDRIYLGSTGIPMKLFGTRVECMNVPYRNFGLDTQATGVNGALWYDSSWGIVGYWAGNFRYLASSYRLRFPTSAPTSPSAGDAYFEVATETLNIWNGTDYTSFKGS